MAGPQKNLPAVCCPNTHFPPGISTPQLTQGSVPESLWLVPGWGAACLHVATLLTLERSALPHSIAGQWACGPWLLSCPLCQASIEHLLPLRTVRKVQPPHDYPAPDTATCPHLLPRSCYLEGGFPSLEGHLEKEHGEDC